MPKHHFKENVTLPSFSTYGNYSNSNYGAHALCFTDAVGNRYWFSYQTLVAFQRGFENVVVHENDWGPTTGKHLNAIDTNKKARLKHEDFQAAFVKAFGRAKP